MQLLESNNFGDINVFDRITDGFFTTDRDWIIRSWNLPAEALLNISAVDIIGKNLWQSFDATISLKFFSEFHPAFEQNLPVYFKDYYPPLNVWFQVAAYPMKERILIFFAKFDDCKHDQEFSSFYHDRYRYMFNQSPSAIFVWSLSDCRIREVNDTALKIIGYSREQVCHKSIFDFVLEEDYPAISGLADLSGKEIKESLILKLSFVKADGAVVYVRMLVNFLSYNSSKAVIALGRSVTEKHKHDQQPEEKRGSDKEPVEDVLPGLEKQRANAGGTLLDEVNQTLTTVKLLVDAAIEHQGDLELLRTASVHLRKTINKINTASRTLDTGQKDDLSFETVAPSMSPEEI